MMIQAADLFCGAGGTSTGLAMACKALRKPVSLVAVNHWARAVETHRRNHPWADHHCIDLASADAHPSRLVPGGSLDILAASPECTHHSNARGGKPCSEQSRASAWHVLHWAENLNINGILIENVREFRNWGPLKNHRPDPTKKGRLFDAFINALSALGYQHDVTELCAADYGEATTRTRLFIQARRDKRPSWPKKTHANRWRPAAEIIDWSVRGKSIFNRKRPLAPNTIARVKAGLKKFGGEAFLVLFNGTSDKQLEMTAQSLKEPLPTVFGNGAHQALCQPFVMPITHGSDRSQRCHPVSEPLVTITTAHRGELALCEPFIVQCNHGTDARSKNENRAQSIRHPLRTVTTSKTHALCQPFIVPNFGEREGQAPRCYSIDKPLPVVTSHGAGALVEPFFVEYYGTGGAATVNEPLKTLTGKPRFALVEPQRFAMDIHLRMLRPHELAAAMGLEDYELTGNIEEQVKQVGNAVSRRQAQAIFREMLR